MAGLMGFLLQKCANFVQNFLSYFCTNEEMWDSVNIIRFLQQETLAQQIEANRALGSQRQQMKKLRHEVQERTIMLKYDVLVAGKTNHRLVEGLRTEVFQMSNQLNHRLLQLEALLEAQRGQPDAVDTQTSGISNGNTIPESVANPTDDIHQEFYVSAEGNRSRGGRKSTKGSLNDKLNTNCQFCSRRLRKASLTRHIAQFHAAALPQGSFASEVQCEPLISHAA